jgi:NAD(P)-dependent dehydrogenase (short-subunit alcohol dehydrogenase family)
VVGGGSRFGQAVARALAREGAAVAVGCGDEASGCAAVAAVAADMLKAEDCRRMVDAVVERFSKLDVLVNLVGYFGPRGDSWADDFDIARWDWMMDVNLKSVFMASKYAIRRCSAPAAARSPIPARSRP